MPSCLCTIAAPAAFGEQHNKSQDAIPVLIAFPIFLGEAGAEKTGRESSRLCSRILCMKEESNHWVQAICKWRP